MTTKSKSVPIQGGLDLVNPPMKRAGGLLQSVQNFRNDQEGGIQRIGGIERFDGKAGPSETVYYNLNFDQGSIEPEVGQTLVGGTSGTTATVLSYVVNSGDWSTCDAAGTIYAVSVNGTFLDNESIDATSDGGFSNGFSAGFELGISAHVCPALAAVGEAGTFLNYSVPTWVAQSAVSPAPSGEVYDVSYTQDGSLVAIGQENAPYLIIYNANSLTGITGPSVLPTSLVRTLAFNKAGTILAVGSSADGVILYDTSDWSVISPGITGFTSFPISMDFNHAGTLLAVGVARIAFLVEYIRMYDTSTWAKLTDPAVLPQDSVTGVHFSPDDSLLAACNASVVPSVTRNLTIYNTSTWAKLADPAGVDDAPADEVKFSHDQSQLLLVQRQTPFNFLWDTATWTQASTGPAALTYPGNCCAWSSDDSYVAIGDEVGGLRVFDTSDWSEETLGSYPNLTIYDVEFKPV